MQHYIFRKDLENQDTTNWPNWLKSATTIDPVIKIIGEDEVVWENGIFVDGTWDGIIWKDGIVIYANWARGTWENGYWNDGIAHMMHWENGIWKNGIFYNGSFRKGEWLNGNFYSQTFKGNWKNGYSPYFSNININNINVLEKSKYPNWLKNADISNEVVSIHNNMIKWHCGDWNDGTWKDGIWNSGRWYNGRWKNGTFKSGEWYNGDWINGKFNGIWNDGIFRDGEFNGVWNKGAKLKDISSSTNNKYFDLINNIIENDCISSIEDLKKFIINNNYLGDNQLCQDQINLVTM